MLRCSNLNITYQDLLQPLFDPFRLVPDYFNYNPQVKLPLPKMHVTVNLPAMLLTLKSPLLGVVDLRATQSVIEVEMYLDDTMKVVNKFAQIRCNKGDTEVISGVEAGDGEEEMSTEILMYADKKVINVNMKNLRLNFDYHAIMSLKHFFLEGMPRYREQDRDKPFGFKADD